uniref:CC070 protein n=1 Tax=Denticeps clupeoides TaxID=299321 RepID=A0A8C4CFY8_9TELE
EAGSGAKSEKLDEAQALARSCAGRPDFLPCDGLSICATHSHGRCFKLHWCCHLGWCHCKYVYQPMTTVGQLPSTSVPAAPSGYSDTIDLSISLTRRFLRIAPCFLPPPCPESPKYCIISDLFIDDYIVKRINGKMCYVQRPLPPPLIPASKIKGPKMDHCSSPSSSEDSGINALGRHFLESCEEDSEEEEDEELSTDGNSSPVSLWDQDDCSLLSPSKSLVEIIENIETTV